MADERFQAGVVTFRPENFLTVGLIGVIAYLFAVLFVQLLMRAGWLGSAQPAQAAAPSTATPVVV